MLVREGTWLRYKIPGAVPYVEYYLITELSYYDYHDKEPEVCLAISYEEDGEPTNDSEFSYKTLKRFIRQGKYKVIAKPPFIL